jgi:hypothetical protein
MTAMMLVSPKDRRAMGNLARLHVSEHFSIDAMLDRWEKLYEQLLVRSYQPDREMHEAITA